METNSKALEQFIEENNNLSHKVRGLPDLGGSALGGEFTGEVKKAYDAFSVYGNELYS